MSEAPERIWMDPDIKFPECEKQYGCDVEYIRADLYEELEAAFSNMSREYDQRGDRIEELEAKLAKVKTSFRRNMMQAYPKYTYERFYKDFDEMLKGDKT